MTTYIGRIKKVITSKSFRLPALAIAVAAVSAIPAPQAFAAGRCGIVDPSWGFSVCSHDTQGFYGTMRDDLNDGYCVEMKRKTSGGSWTTSGVAGNSACTTGASKAWSIDNNSTVYGLRLYRGNGSYATLCSSYRTCNVY